LFLVLLYERKDLFRLILFLLLPKPPRLRKVRTKMMPKIRFLSLYCGGNPHSPKILY
jgi:hypothetical protein